MSDIYALSQTTIERLSKHARSFETVDALVNRILDFYESNLAPEAEDDVITSGTTTTDFSWASPPDLTHTKVLSIEFNKTKFSRGDTTWNALLNEAACVAGKRAKSEEDLKRLILINYVVGKKEDEGYRYLKDANLSVQGQDANSAWKSVAHIARQLRIPFDVVFTWRLKKGSANPGATGRFVYEANEISVPRLSDVLGRKKTLI